VKKKYFIIAILILLGLFLFYRLKHLPLSRYDCLRLGSDNAIAKCLKYYFTKPISTSIPLINLFDKIKPNPNNIQTFEEWEKNSR